ncbi:MAG: BrnA antitoxin family protein [Rhodanobacteraceae bacterium]
MAQRIGELIACKRGRPVVGEPKEAISLRMPHSVLERWKATGPGWQTRMVERLSAP